MAEEAGLEQTEVGTTPTGDGWFVLNARDSVWLHAEGRSAICIFEGRTFFDQFGINIGVHQPGQAMAMYHWEADQEDFLVLAGQGVLVVEGEERPVKAWDFIHCPAGTKHVLVGAGTEPFVVVAIGARVNSADNPNWGGYVPDETAAKYGASVERETNEPTEAYAGMRLQQPTRYRDGWLPG